MSEEEIRPEKEVLMCAECIGRGHRQSDRKDVPWYDEWLKGAYEMVVPGRGTWKIGAKKNNESMRDLCCTCLLDDAVLYVVLTVW